MTAMPKAPISDPALAAMLDYAERHAVGRLDRSERVFLEGHDPANPFSRKSIRRESEFTRTYIILSGNQARHPVSPVWYDQNGNEIDAPNALTMTWSRAQAEDIARQLRDAGYPARHELGRSSFKCSEGEIIVESPAYESVKPPVAYSSDYITAHWVTIHAHVQHLTGRKEIRSWRTDSVGRSDIGQEIISRIRAYEACMPANPEEAQKIAVQKGMLELGNLFAKHNIEPRIVSIEYPIPRGSMTIGIRHEMLNGLLQWTKQTTYIRFHGYDINNPWEADIDGLTGKSGNHKLSIEASRRALLEKTGGLRQTSLAREVIQIMGYETIPLRVDSSGKISPIRFRLPGDTLVEGTLEVKAGRIEASIDIADGAASITTGSFSVRDAKLSASALAGAKGTPLRHVIDHPAIDPGIVITSIKEKGEGIKGRIRMPTYLVDQRAENDV